MRLTCYLPRENLLRVEKRQAKLHQWLQSRKLTGEEKQAIQFANFEDAVSFWSTMTNCAQSKFLAHHKKGWRRWVGKYQTFAKGAYLFMEDIRPLLEVAEPAGCPYLGVAARTISLLFLARLCFFPFCARC